MGKGSEMDLIERLLEAAALPNGLYAEAAAELKRLRAEVVEEKRVAIIHEADAVKYGKMVIELRAELEEQCRLNGCGSEREAKLKAENDALRAALKAQGGPVALLVKRSWTAQVNLTTGIDNLPPGEYPLYTTPQPAGNAELLLFLRALSEKYGEKIHKEFFGDAVKQDIDAAIAKAEGGGDANIQR